MIDIRFKFVFREVVACEYIDIVIIVSDGLILAVSDARVFDLRVGLRILPSAVIGRISSSILIVITSTSFPPTFTPHVRRGRWYVTQSRQVLARHPGVDDDGVLLRRGHTPRLLASTYQHRGPTCASTTRLHCGAGAR